VRIDKEIEKIHQRLKESVNETGHEILEEGVDTENNIWVLKVKHGNFIVLLLHPLKQKCAVIRFVFQMPKEHQKILQNHFSDPIMFQQLAYGIRAAITSPHTSHQFLLDGEKSIIGFQIDSKVYPSDKSFSLGGFDNSIQSVVSLGLMGISFIGTMLQLGEIAIKQQEALTSSPEGIYQ